MVADICQYCFVYIKCISNVERTDHVNLNYIIQDALSDQYHEKFLAALSELNNTDLVAEVFNA